jgi:methionine synthase II (cobalamin-independent)
MAQRNRPPFRADHVGSLLRPDRLRDARADFKAGRATAEDLRAVEDDSIRDVIELQRDAGLQTVTDGELRRTSWHMDFIYSLGGITQVAGESLHVQFHNEEGTYDYAPPAMKVAGKVTLPETIFADAFTFLRDNALPGQTPKLTIPSPSMVHYRGGNSSIDHDVYPDMEEFWTDLTSAYADEVRALGEAGVVEVNLIAQDLTRYGWDAGTSPEARATLAQLLRALGKVDAVSWIRLHYTFPSAFDDELIDAIASEPKVVKYIDVPLQHISDAMLKRMRRGHSSRVTRDLIAKLRARIDGAVLRTTFIVGHPGETAAEFDELCAFVAESKFDRAGAFTYSIEPGTVSALLPHRIDPGVAAERQQTLMELQRQISRARHEAMVGRELDVLVEGVSSESDYLMEGRWYGQAPGIDGVTYLADGRVPPGSLVRARVTQASDYDLAATLEL